MMDLGIRCRGCGGNIPGKTVAAGPSYHYECKPRDPTPLEIAEERLRAAQKENAAFRAALVEIDDKLDCYQPCKPTPGCSACGKPADDRWCAGCVARKALVEVDGPEPII